MANKARFNYRIEEDLLTKIKLIAYEKGVPLNNLLHSFVSEYIERYEKENGIITPEKIKIITKK